jgi:acetyl esterase
MKPQRSKMKSDPFFELIIEPGYGPLNPKVNLKPDFSEGFTPERRQELVTADAAFHKEITSPFSVETRIEQWYEGFTTKDGASIKVKFYKPKGKNGKLPIHVFYHGGGWRTCNIETHNFIPSYIAANAGVMVASVDYRLAPEYKFPHGIEDCYQATQWVYSKAQELSIDVSRLTVGGSSSGGNFAAVMCIMAKERKDFQIAGQVLIYAATGLLNRIKTRSLHEYHQILGISIDKDGRPNKALTSTYLNEKDDPANPYISPLFANDVTGLPQAIFIEAECDPLLDEGLMYAKKLQAAGVKVEYEIYKGMPHGFIRRTYEETFTALDRICEFLKTI